MGSIQICLTANESDRSNLRCAFVDGTDLTTGDWTYSFRDPLGMINGPNIYAYTRGNPIMRIDPLGLDFEEGLEDFVKDEVKEKITEKIPYYDLIGPGIDTYNNWKEPMENLPEWQNEAEDWFDTCADPNNLGPNGDPPSDVQGGVFQPYAKGASAGADAAKGTMGDTVGQGIPGSGIIQKIGKFLGIFD